MNVEVKELTIKTLNGHSIAVVQFSAEKKINKTLIISSATGVLQKYYSKFATHFATLGYVVYTFDYHGIGKSNGQVQKLKQNNSDLKSWGSVDQAAVVDYAKKQNPNFELTVLTHSVGGQVLGFNPNYNSIDKVVMVASQSGYWPYFSGIHYPKMWLLWYIIIPILTRVFGYFPAKVLGLFENLPKNMVYEWAKWGKRKEYLMHYHNDQEYFFDKFTIPMLSFSFPKDNYAPKNTVDWLANQYKNSKMERVHYEPSKDKINRLKHFGFFREEFKDTLWKKTEEWLQKS